jgi:hypothetical protein
MALARRSRQGPLFALALACALAACVASCGHSAPPPRSLVEDKARRDVPIAVCRKPLAPTDLVESGAPRPEAYWSALLPGFSAFGSSFPAADCVGGVVSTEARRTGGALTTAPTIHVSSTDWAVSPAPDGNQLVLLRTFSGSDRVASGLLALVHPRPSLLDVYAIGFYRGSTQHSRFDVAKVEAAPLVIAHDDECADVKVEAECQSMLSFYLVVGGELALAGQTPSERLKYGSLKDVGRVKWRLLTDPPTFEPLAIRIKEKLSVHDASDNEVRKLESERVFTLQGTTLVGVPESLWAQVDRR